jgi:hypothetical protein
MDLREALCALPRARRRRRAARRRNLSLWHAEVAGASLVTLHHFEVALRNAVDRTLGADNPEAPLEETWLLDPETLSAQGTAKVRSVLGRLEREGYPRERQRVIASLPFSFWKGLFARRYEHLWRTRLRHAFPGAGLRREILEPLTNLLRSSGMSLS